MEKAETVNHQRPEPIDFLLSSVDHVDAQVDAHFTDRIWGESHRRFQGNVIWMTETEIRNRVPFHFFLFLILVSP